jgi:hypothetical protein
LVLLFFQPMNPHRSVYPLTRESLHRVREGNYSAQMLLEMKQLL